MAFTMIMEFVSLVKEIVYFVKMQIHVLNVGMDSSYKLMQKMMEQRVSEANV